MVPTAIPIKVPIAGLKDFFKLLLFTYSPEIAPKNEPISNPRGPARNKPSKSPIVDPIKPFFDPPNFLRPNIGIIKSKPNIKAAIKKVINRNWLSNGINLEKWITNNPNQLVIGPGIIGLKLPTIPNKHNIKPRISKNISTKIFYLKLYLILE